MKKVNFVCPKCGGTFLVVVEEVIETSYVTGLDAIEDVEFLRGGDVQDSEVTAVLQYECDSCHYGIGSTNAQVIRWLRKHGMIEGEEKNV